jgi:hypothetical protein
VNVELQLQVGNARKAVVTIGKKTLLTPTYGTFLKKKRDLDIVCNAMSKSPLENIGFISSYIFDIEGIIQEKENNLSTTTLQDFGIGGEKEREYKHLRSKAIWCVDPCTSDYAYSTNEHDRLISYKGFSPEIQKLIASFNNQNHDKKWADLFTNKPLYMKFIRENIVAQIVSGMDFIVPPTPLITADSPSYMVEIWYDIVKTCGTYAAAAYHMPSSILMNVHSNNFTNPKNIEAMLRKLESSDVTKELMDSRLLLLKVVFPDFESATGDVRLRYKDFTTELAIYASATKSAVFALNVNSVGLVSIANGLDGFVEPINGVLSGIAKSKSKRGRYYHPDSLKFYPYTSVKEIVNNSGTLPCHCDFCKSFRGRDLDQALNTQEWNDLRRGHLLMSRNDELRECVETLHNGTIVGGMAEKVRRSDVSNFAQILPNSY